MRSPAAPVLAVLWLLRTMAAVDGAATTVVVGGANDPDYYDEGETGLEETTPDGAEPGLGMYLGSPCLTSCHPSLAHVFCDPVTGLCECEKQFPVRLGPTKGCAKPVRLGDQCFYLQTCTFTDQHAECKQISHNAICQCKEGYHVVALQRPTKKVFCTEDLVLLTTDMPTLFGVATGLAIFTALICFVLKLFSRARFSRPRHYANANLAPPILFSSDTGIPLAVHGGRPSSRASSQRSAGTLASRRPSSAGLASRGVVVPASRAGSRRPSLASLHSTTSSSRSMSFSMRKYERENQQREARALQLQQQQQQQMLAMQQHHMMEKEQLGLQHGGPSPSPRTPMSTDELLPSVSEVREEGLCNSGSSSGSSHRRSASYQGPCTSAEASR